DRKVQVEWSPTEDSMFLVAMHVEALDRARLLSDITRVLSDQHVNILSATVQTSRDRVAQSRFTFEMADPTHLRSVLRAVRNVDGVYDVFRVRSGVHRDRARQVLRPTRTRSARVGGCRGRLPRTARPIASSDPQYRSRAPVGEGVCDLRCAFGAPVTASATGEVLSGGFRRWGRAHRRQKYPGPFDKKDRGSDGSDADGRGPHDLEHRVTFGLVLEILHRRIRKDVEVRTDHGGARMVQILAQYRGGFARADLAHTDQFDPATLAQGRKPIVAQVAGPIDLPVRGDQDSSQLAVQDTERDGAQDTGRASARGEQVQLRWAHTVL